MSTRRKGLRFGGFLLASVVLTACGGGGGDDSPQMQPPPASLSGDAFAITSANRLLSFTRTMPSQVMAASITGLQSGETVIGIDVRPLDNSLYVLTNAGRVYLLNGGTAVATLKSTLAADPSDITDPFTGLVGTAFSVDFDPVFDRLRVISDQGQNLSVNVDSGMTVTDGPLASGGMARTGVAALAFTTNFPAACRTTSFFIDTAADRLLSANDASTGALTDIGPLGVDAASVAGYEIITASNGSDTAFAALAVGGRTGLYTIDLSTGSVSANAPDIGSLDTGETVTGLAIVRSDGPPNQPLGNMLGVTESNKLISFNVNAPRKLCTSVQITGLQNNERLLGIDTRPANGRLYALGSSGRVYTIDPTTGAVSATVTLAPDTGGVFNGLSGTEFGFEFNPIVDQVRVVSDAGQNIRIKADNGATNTDTALNPAGSAVTSLAYTNGFTGAGAIKAYVLDSAGDRLMGLGMAPGSPGAGNGDLTPIGPLGIGDISSVSSLEINGVNNDAYAAITLTGSSTSELDKINLMTGAATRVDTIGGGERVRGIAYTAVPTATVFATTADNRLVSFNPLTPATLISNVPITGLQGGDQLLGIDFRPANGLLYGLTAGGRVYTLDTTSGAATMVSTLAPDPSDPSNPFTMPMGTSFAFDWNPNVDVIRVYSDAEQNFRFNADTGLTVTATNIQRGDVDVTAVAYDNSVPNFPANGVTTLYDIDTKNDVVYTQSPANSGTLTVVGPLLVDAQSVSAFEIVGPSTGIAALSTAAAPQGFYSINLSTGAATLVGNISLPGPTDRITGMSAMPSAVNPPANSQVFAIVNGTAFISFARNAPGAATAPVPITGLMSGETIVGADIRPANSMMYALTSARRLLKIDTTTAAATLVATLITQSGSPFPAFAGTSFGVDFSPAADALRVVTDAGENVAIIPDPIGASGASPPGTVVTATSLNFVAPPDIVAVGYTSNYVNGPPTRALVLDVPTGSLMRVNPADAGTLMPIGRLNPNLTFTKTAAFDIVGGDDGLSLAALQRTGDSQSTLYRVNPLTGSTGPQPLGPIGPAGTQLVRGMAIKLQ